MSDLDLARRAVACPRWRWMEGMRWTRPDASMWQPLAGRIESDDIVMLLDALPDLDDPATVGCLLALAREAWARPFLCALYALDGHWYVYDMGAPPYAQPVALDGVGAPSEATALVAALESAP